MLLIGRLLMCLLFLYVGWMQVVHQDAHNDRRLCHTCGAKMNGC